MGVWTGSASWRESRSSASPGSSSASPPPRAAPGVAVAGPERPAGTRRPARRTYGAPAAALGVAPRRGGRRSTPSVGRYRRARRRLRRQAVLPVLRAVRRRTTWASTSRQPGGRPRRVDRGAAGRGRVVRRRALHAGARALRRSRAGRARAPARRRRRAAACSLSTHGVQVYHPAPHDLWRWTHAGLERLFLTNGTGRALAFGPAAGTAATPRALARRSTSTCLLPRARRAARARSSSARCSALGERGRRARRVLREPGPGSLHANYHVTAVA